jgi:hypothetical protein
VPHAYQCEAVRVPPRCDGHKGTICKCFHPFQIMEKHRRTLNKPFDSFFLCSFESLNLVFDASQPACKNPLIVPDLFAENCERVCRAQSFRAQGAVRIQHGLKRFLD